VLPSQKQGHAYEEAEIYNGPNAHGFVGVRQEGAAEAS